MIRTERYTKVNRSITEGRRRFMDVYASLETGAECDRFGPLLRLLADGRATSEQLVELRPHLRRCPACRATVRDLHRRRGLPVLLPGVAVGWRWLRERFGDHSPSPRPLRFRPDPDPLGIGRRLRHHVTSVVQRANSSDVAAGVHIATTTGGGRIATVGTIVGLCVSSLGAGAICVVTGVLHLDLDPPHHPVAVVHPTVTVAPVRHVRALSTELVAVHSSPTPSPTPRPHRAVARPRHRPTAAAPRTPPATTSQQAPISPAPPQPAAQEFAAAPASGAGTRTPPAAAPSTGGEEFAP